MLNSFNEFIYPKGNSTVILPSWKYFTDKLYNYNSFWMNRFSNIKHYDTKGSALLINILKLADVDYLIKHGDDFDAYRIYVRQSQKIYDTTFDPIKLQSTKVKRYFTSKNGYDIDGCDIVLPVNDVDHLKILPLGYKYNHGWKDVIPLTYTYTPTLEYTQNLGSGTLAYKDIPPKCAIFRLDSVALVMKYFVWYLEHPEFQTDVLKRGDAPYKFLREEIYPILITQSTTAFLWQLLNTVVHSAVVNKDKLTTENVDSLAINIVKNIIITTEYTNYFTDVIKAVKELLIVLCRVKDRTLDIKQVLSMNLHLKCFSNRKDNNNTFHDFKEEIDDKYNTAYLSQYYYIEFLTEIFLLTYLDNLYILGHSENTNTDYYFTKKKYVLTRLITAVRPTILQHEYVQNTVNVELKKFNG